MVPSQYNRFLGIVCVIVGLVLLILVAGELLLRISGAFLALYLVSYGLRLQGYPMSRVIFMAQQWRSKF